MFLVKETGVMLDMNEMTFQYCLILSGKSLKAVSNPWVLQHWCALILHFSNLDSWHLNLSFYAFLQSDPQASNHAGWSWHQQDLSHANTSCTLWDRMTLRSLKRLCTMFSRSVRSESSPQCPSQRLEQVLCFNGLYWTTLSCVVACFYCTCCLFCCVLCFYCEVVKWPYALLPCALNGTTFYFS